MANVQTATKKTNQRIQAEVRDLEPVEMGRDVIEYLREYARGESGSRPRCGASGSASCWGGS